MWSGGGEKMRPLSCAPADTLQTIKWCILEDCDGCLLKSLGLVQGAEIKIIASHFGNVIISVGNLRIALGKEIADRIRV